MPGTSPKLGSVEVVRGVVAGALVIAVGCSSSAPASSTFDGDAGRFQPFPESDGGSEPAPSPFERQNPAVPPPPTCPPTVAPAPVNQTATHAAVPLIHSEDPPWAIAIDLQFIYWLAAGDKNPGIWRAPKTGGTPTALYKGPMTAVTSIGIDGTSLYFPAKIDGSNSIAAVPLAGGPLPPRILAAGIGDTQGVVVAAGYAYWLEGAYGVNGPVGKRVPVDGGAAVQTAYAPITDVGATNGSAFTALGPDGAYIALSDGTVDHFPLDWSKPDGIAINDRVGALAIDADHVYFAGASTIASLGKAGGCPTLLAGSLENPRGIAIDATSIYFTDSTENGTVNAVPKAGGAPSILVSGQGKPTAIAVDATQIYWANQIDSTINAVGK